MKFEVFATTRSAAAADLVPSGWNPPPPGADRVKKAEKGPFWPLLLIFGDFH